MRRDNKNMPSNSPTHLKNKTLTAWLAFITGQLGLHRFYLFGAADPWAWLHPVVASIGWLGVRRVQMYGLDDQISWVLIPLLGFTLAATALTAIYYGLMSTEKWNHKFNPGTPDAPAGQTHWLTIGAVVFSLLFGAVALVSSIVFSFQRYFEFQLK